MDGCKNNTEKSPRTKVSEHISSCFSMSTISSFKDIENKHDVCRGKDCIKKYCIYLKEHAVKIIICNPIHHGIFGSGSQGAQSAPLKLSKTKNDLSMKLSSQKHVSFVSIVCLVSCLVCVTWCDYNVIYMTTPCKLCKLDI